MTMLEYANLLTVYFLQASFQAYGKWIRPLIFAVWKKCTNQL